ncbi:hypothetical protein HOK51_07430 [Candidatus Woesearchaeota archaeon]|jgi:hypothetical protein|nr:hypothetical protein [Candidatus Woesearchaeota archaeon]MBT6519654.1 hypothetical protein [Candidatus Woesearchaeota archaeon]MBT7368700.1 hypothetical protein [Candidatus Woesearchaeota archaeon]
MPCGFVSLFLCVYAAEQFTGNIGLQIGAGSIGALTGLFMPMGIAKVFDYYSHKKQSKKVAEYLKKEDQSEKSFDYELIRSDQTSTENIE